MSLSPSASWRCRSTPPTRCGCPSGKPSGSFSSWPSEELRAKGGWREGKGRKEDGRNLTRALSTFLQWRWKTEMGSGDGRLEVWKHSGIRRITQRENVSSTKQCQGSHFLSFALSKTHTKKISICYKYYTSSPNHWDYKIPIISLVYNFFTGFK